MKQFERMLLSKPLTSFLIIYTYIEMTTIVSLCYHETFSTHRLATGHILHEFLTCRSSG